MEHLVSGSGPSTTRCLIASILLLSVVAVPVAAQDGQGRFEASTSSGSKISGQFNVRGTVGVPQGGFENNVSGLGGGLNLFIGGWVGPRSPVMAGLDVGFLSYGNSTEQVPFSSTVGPRLPVEVETSNNVLETHLSLRLQPRHGRIRPFVEGLVGFKYLFTRTSLAEEDFGNDFGDRDGLSDELASTTNFDDFAFSGGAGAGVDVRVYRQDDPKTSVRSVSVHLGVQYLLGQEAEYLAEGDLTDDNENGQLDRSEMDVRRSRTTFLQPQFGVTFRFTDGDN